MDSDHQRRLVTLRITYQIFLTLKCLQLLMFIILLAVAIVKLHALNFYIFDVLVVGFCVCHYLHLKTYQIYQIQSAQRDAGVQPQPSDQSHQTLSVQIDRRIQLQPLRAERIEQSESSPRFFNIALVARVIASLLVLPPTKIFESRESSDQTTGSDDECAICLEDFKNGDLVQSFPKCNHVFHSTCINTWLQDGNITCPNCRFSLHDLLEGG